MRRRWTWMIAAVVTGGCAAPPEVASPSVPEPAPATVAEVTVPAGDVGPGPAGGTIVFQSDREGRSKLFTLDLRTHVVARWTSGPDHQDVEPVWSPDGRRVAFSSTRFDARTFDLAVAERGAAVQRLTTHTAFDRQPAWAPDGRSLFFASEQDGTQAVFRLALADGAVARLSPPPERAMMPAAAPDGMRVAYVMGGREGLQVMLQDLTSGALSRLTTGAAAAVWPAWSPDGTRIACVRLDANGTARLEVIQMSSRATTVLALEGVSALREPAWSPDGHTLVLAGASATGPASDWDLVLVRLDAAPLFARLTSGRGNDLAPSWSVR